MHFCAVFLHKTTLKQTLRHELRRVKKFFAIRFVAENCENLPRTNKFCGNCRFLAIERGSGFIISVHALAVVVWRNFYLALEDGVEIRLRTETAVDDYVGYGRVALKQHFLCSVYLLIYNVLVWSNSCNLREEFMKVVRA